MVQKIFIFTDIMKTGNHVQFEEFINFCQFDEYNITMDGKWYSLHEYDFKNYDKKIAFLDTRLGHEFNQNKYYKRDLQERISYLEQNGFCIVYANPWESEHYFPTDRPAWTGGRSWFWYLMYNRYKNQKDKFYHVQKPYDFLYLNKTDRSHRRSLYTKLKQKNLLDRSLSSYLADGVKLNRKYELPWVDAENYPAYGHDRDIYEPQFNHTKFNIVSETRADGQTFITEKTWKPIMAKQLFIVHGKANFLKDLRDLGFRTYGDYIDESYDTIQDLEQRTDAIVKLCESLKGKTHIWLYADTREIREHNRNVFFSERHLREACRKDLKKLFELVDRSEVSF